MVTLKGQCNEEREVTVGFAEMAAWQCRVELGPGAALPSAPPLERVVILADLSNLVKFQFLLEVRFDNSIGYGAVAQYTECT